MKRDANLGLNKWVQAALNSQVMSGAEHRVRLVGGVLFAASWWVLGLAALGHPNHLALGPCMFYARGWLSPQARVAGHAQKLPGVQVTGDLTPFGSRRHGTTRQAFRELQAAA